VHLIFSKKRNGKGKQIKENRNKSRKIGIRKNRIKKETEK